MLNENAGPANLRHGGHSNQHTLRGIDLEAGEVSACNTDGQSQNAHQTRCFYIDTDDSNAETGPEQQKCRENGQCDAETVSTGR